MKPKIMVLYYSLYGNNFKMAKAVCKGIEDENAEAFLRTVPELMPKELIDKDPNIKKSKELQKSVPIANVKELENIDGLILGSPTRFGNMCAQMRNFWDRTGSLWVKGSLIDKPAGVFSSSASMHGGQETTLISMMFTLFHHGAIILGVPYSVKELAETKNGGTPYGPTAVVGQNSDKSPTESDLIIAKALGKRIANTAKKLIKT